MVNKKAQLKIQQMAFMLMAVTLFFVLAGMFVLVFKFAGLKESATELERKNAMMLVTKLANSPEFSCGFSFDETKPACIDADKVMMLKESHISKYDNFWGVSNIEIRKIYPKANTEIMCNVKNYPNCNIIRIREKEITGTGQAKNFVSLCRKESFEGEIYNKCELAIIIIEEK